MIYSTTIGKLVDMIPGLHQSNYIFFIQGGGGANSRYGSIGWDNGLAPNGLWAIISTSNDLVYWRLLLTWFNFNPSMDK